MGRISQIHELCFVMLVHLFKSVPVKEGRTKSPLSHSTVIIMIGKVPCWMPKSEGKSLNRNWISACSKIFVSDKGGNSNLSGETRWTPAYPNNEA